MNNFKVEQTNNLFWGKLFLALLLLLVVTDLQTIAAVTPQIAQSFETSTTLVSYSFVSYSLAAVVTAILLRKFPNKLNNTKLIPLLTIFYSFSSGLGTLVPNIYTFLLARGICGLAGGLISALTITSLANVTNYEKRGVNMNFISFGYFMAPLLGVPLSAILTDYFGWRSGFLIIAFSLLMIGFLIKNFPLPVIESPIRLIENRMNADFTRSLRMGIISAFFVSGSIVGLSTFIGTWLFDSWRSTALEVGFSYFLINFGSLIGGILGGFLADKLGKRIVILNSNLLMVGCLFLLTCLTWKSGIFVLIIIVNFAAALRVAPLQALLTELVLPDETAAYLAARNIASQIGIGFAVLFGGLIYTQYELAGLSIFCAILAAGAWLTIKMIIEPDLIRKPGLPNAVYD